MATQNQGSTSPSGRHSGLFLNILPIHELMAVIAAAALVLVVYGKVTAFEPKTVEEAARHVGIVSGIAIIYLGIQAAAALRQPVGPELSMLRDIVISSLPLLVIVYALVDYARNHGTPGGLEFNYLTWISVLIWGLTTFIDTVIFSMFTLRFYRRS